MRGVFVTRAVVMTGARMNQATVVLLLQSPQKPSTSLAVVPNRRCNMNTPSEYTKYLDIHITGN
jgi:hypothetical protein